MKKKKIVITIILFLCLLLIACLFVPSIVDRYTKTNDKTKIEKQEKNDNEDDDLNNKEQPEFENEKEIQDDGKNDDSNNENNKTESNETDKDDDRDENNENTVEGDSDNENNNSSKQDTSFFTDADMTVKNNPRIFSNNCSILTEEYEETAGVGKGEFLIKTQTEVNELVDGDVIEVHKLIEPRLIAMCEKNINEKVICQCTSINKVESKSGNSVFVIYGKMIGQNETRAFTAWYNEKLDEAYEYKHIKCMGMVDQTGNERFFQLIMAAAVAELQDYEGGDTWY